MAEYRDLPELGDADLLVSAPYFGALAKSGNDLDLKSFNNLSLRQVNQFKQADEYIANFFGLYLGLTVEYTHTDDSYASVSGRTGSAVTSWSRVGTLRGRQVVVTSWINDKSISNYTGNTGIIHIFSYRTTILTSDGVVVYGIREYREKETTPGGSVSYTFGSLGSTSYGSTASPADEGSKVKQEPEDRLAELIDSSWLVLGPLVLADNLGSVRARINWYGGLNRFQYYTVDYGGEGRDADTGEWGSAPSMVFNQAGWDAAVQDRVDGLESSIGSRETIKASQLLELGQLQTELATLHETAASDDEANWRDQIDASLADHAEYARIATIRNGKIIALQPTLIELEELQAEENELEAKKEELEAKGESLSDEDADRLAELEALIEDLEAEIEPKQLEIDDLYWEMQPYVFSGAGYSDSAAGLILRKEREIARKQEDIAVQQARIDSMTACKTSIAADPESDHYYLSYAQDNFSIVACDYYDDFSLSQITGEIENKGRTKRSGRYRIVIELPAGLRHAGEIDVQWAETSQPASNKDITAPEEGSGDPYVLHEWDPNPTRTYKAVTLAVSASQAEVQSQWYDVAAPELAPTETQGITIGSPFYGQPTNEQYSAEIEMRKAGIYGYEPSEPPQIYRKEVWSGGHAGCAASGLDPVSYEWEVGSLTAEEQAALPEEKPVPPGYKPQPQTVGFLSSSLPLMYASDLTASSMDSRTWFARAFTCEDSAVPHIFKTDLIDLLETMILKSSGDDYAEDYLAWYAAWKAGSATYAERPTPWDYGPDGYEGSYTADYDVDGIFEQLLDGRVIKEKIARSWRDRGAIQAINYLSSDEVTYLTKKSMWRSSLHGTRANLPDARIALKFTRFTINLETHEITEVPETRIITAVQDESASPPNDYEFVMEYESLEAPVQSFVLLADFYVDIDESDWGTANSVYDNQVLFAGGDPEIIDARVVVTEP